MSMRAAVLSLLPLLLAACFEPSASAGEKSVFELTESDFTSSRVAALSGQPAASACGGDSGACMQVTKGDILLIKANGTLQTELGAVGPQGSLEWLGGMPFVFVNRVAFGLFGRIGRSVFPIGDELAVIAPETGTLELVVNGCDPNAAGGGWSIDCTTNGAINATIFSKLASGVTLASNPPLTDNTVSSTDTFALSAGGDWQPTGVQLKKGQKVFVTATGTATVNEQLWNADGSTTVTGVTSTVDANGAANGYIGGFAFLLKNRFIYRLYARVGTNVVDVGSSAAFLSPAKGELELVLNHQVPNDTSGTLTVTIGSGVVPARGLLHADAQAFAQAATVGVPANGLWKPTTISVNQGDPLVVSATGQVTGSSLHDATSIDAWGEGAIGGYPYPLPNRPRFALFGRVGPTPFYLGGENALLAPASGTVELLVNHSSWCHSGSVCSAGGAPGDNCVHESLCDVQGGYTATVAAP